MRFYAAFSLLLVVVAATEIAPGAFGNFGGSEKDRLTVNGPGRPPEHIRRAGIHLPKNPKVREESDASTHVLQRRFQVLQRRADSDSSGSALDRVGSAPLPTSFESPRLSLPLPRNSPNRNRVQNSARSRPRQATPPRQVSPSRQAGSTQQVNPSIQAGPSRPVSPPRGASPPRQVGPSAQAGSSRQVSPPREASPPRITSPNARSGSSGSHDNGQPVSPPSNAVPRPSSPPPLTSIVRSPGREEAEQLAMARRGSVMEATKFFGGAAMKSPVGGPKPWSRGASSPNSGGSAGLRVKTGNEQGSSNPGSPPSPPRHRTSPPNMPRQPNLGNNNSQRGNISPGRGNNSPPRGGNSPPLGNNSPPRGNNSPPRGGNSPPLGNSSPSRPNNSPPRGGNSPPRGNGTPQANGGLQNDGLSSSSSSSRNSGNLPNHNPTISNNPSHIAGPSRSNPLSAPATDAQIEHLTRRPGSPANSPPDSPTKAAIDEVKWIQKGKWTGTHPFSNHPTLTGKYTEELWNPAPKPEAEVQQPPSSVRTSQPGLWIGERPQSRPAQGATNRATGSVRPSEPASGRISPPRDQTPTARAGITNNGNNSPQEQNAVGQTNHVPIKPPSERQPVGPRPDSKGQKSSSKGGKSNSKGSGSGSGSPPAAENRLTSGVLRAHDEILADTPEVPREPSFSQFDRGHNTGGSSSQGSGIKRSPKSIALADHQARVRGSTDAGSPQSKQATAGSPVGTIGQQNSQKKSSGSGSSPVGATNAVTPQPARGITGQGTVGSTNGSPARIDDRNRGNIHDLLSTSPPPTGGRPRNSPTGNTNPTSATLPGSSSGSQNAPGSGTLPSGQGQGRSSFSFVQEPPGKTNTKLLQYMDEGQIVDSLKEGRDEAQKKKASRSPTSQGTSGNNSNPSSNRQGSGSQAQNSNSPDVPSQQQQNNAPASNSNPGPSSKKGDKIKPPLPIEGGLQKSSSGSSDIDFHEWRKKHPSPKAITRTVSQFTDSSDDTTAAVIGAPTTRQPPKYIQSQVLGGRRRESPATSSIPTPNAITTGGGPFGGGGAGGIRVHTNPGDAEKPQKTCALLATVLNCLYDWSGGEMPPRLPSSTSEVSRKSSSKKGGKKPSDPGGGDPPNNGGGSQGAGPSSSK